MLSSSTKTSVLPQTKYFGPALVLEINKNEEMILLQMEGYSYHEQAVWAKSALPINHEFQFGEKVLITGEDIDEIFIIGLLDQKNKSKTDQKVIVMKDGSRAKIERESDEEKLKLCSKSGELIFEYSAISGKSFVKIPKGDLEILTASGNIDFASEGNIRFTSKQSVELKSNQDICLQTTNSVGKKLSALSLRNRKMKLEGMDVDISAQRSQIFIAESKYAGKQFQGRIKNVKLVMGKLESLTNTVIEKAENIYKSVIGLTQLKTGRMRTLVDSTYHLKGKKVNIKAEQDFKVKGEKIHLG